MTDEPKGERDRVTARIEAMQEQLDALRRDVEDLEQSQGDDRRGLATVRQDVTSLRHGQDSLAAAVGEMRCEQLGLLAQVKALAGRVPTGGAVVVAGGAAGAPALVLLVIETLRWFSH